jgi:peptide methionine sulfoxide reductase MsrA
MIKRLDAAHVFASKIVTEVKPFERFYKAEKYHQDFYSRNADYGYCQVVINPKLNKLYKEFSDELKETE